MDPRGIAETVGAGLACAVAAATFQVVAGAIDWPLVLGIGASAAIAGAANYRARTTHTEAVAEEAPVE